MKRSWALPASLQEHRFVWLMLVIAFVLRLIVVLTYYWVDQTHSSDGLYYIVVSIEPLRLLYREGASVTSIGPIYPIFLIPFFNLIPHDARLIQFVSVRIAHALLDTATVGLVYLLARHLLGERVGRVALLMQALDARYIFQLGVIATETLFIALFAAFMLVYVTAVSQQSFRRYRWAGVLLGIATLTRPVPQLFPLFLFPQARLTDGSRRESMLCGIAWTLAMMLAVTVPWIIRTALVTGQLIPVADTVFTHWWMNSREDGRDLDGRILEEAAVEDTGVVEPPESPDELVPISAIPPWEYIRRGFSNILSQPAVWLGRTAREVGAAYSQPYGTGLMIDPDTYGAKDVLRDVLAGRISFNTLVTLPGIWRRMLMYVWHYWGLIGGIAGIVIAIRRRQWSLYPLIAWILYGTVVLSVLLIQPRYLFPLMFSFTVLAAYSTVEAWDTVRQRLPMTRPLSGEPI